MNGTLGLQVAADVCYCAGPEATIGKSVQNVDSVWIDYDYSYSTVCLPTYSNRVIRFDDLDPRRRDDLPCHK